jgi:hypothetical protein
MNNIGYLLMLSFSMLLGIATILVFEHLCAYLIDGFFLATRTKLLLNLLQERYTIHSTNYDGIMGELKEIVFDECESVNGVLLRPRLIPSTFGDRMVNAFSTKVELALCLGCSIYWMYVVNTTITESFKIWFITR